MAKTTFKVAGPGGVGSFAVVDTNGVTTIELDGSPVAVGEQQATITNASTAHALNSTFSDTEVESALNALGTKINAILTALKANGLLASS